MILLDDQDRSKWNKSLIAEGLALIDKAMRHRRSGPYQVQAAIAALHGEPLLLLANHQVAIESVLAGIVLAFYFWLRQTYGAHALIHVGKHGNLEWLPGKALALSEECFPEAALGPLPHLYPFIVNDPGEGTQAKRRAHAVIGDDVEVGRGTSVGSHAQLQGPAVFGEHNRIFAHAVLGFEPQDLKYHGEPTRLVVGSRNVFREFSTVHRGTVKGGGDASKPTTTKDGQTMAAPTKSPAAK